MSDKEIPVFRDEIAKANKQKILEYYLQEIEATGKAPTQVKIAEAVGLSRQCVSNHMKNLVLPEIIDHYKKSAPEIMNGLIKKAKAGDVPATKLYFQVVYGWNEKKIIEGNITNKTLQVQITGDKEEVKNIIQKLDNNSKNDVIRGEIISEDKSEI